ncbi:MBL fold metallo-hydrolase [Microvirga rosea]|uniref:MBL fold metallo-hydrolase n=1 Tax=Microvirga rosea TaxID=2715425 RepID=UPI001D0A43C1|nr:MBL fold metallo-hydrolase [Microvirga rosea]MCB8823510.1 MBL fold metallo-hydrolase [Microvirga rosea]
MVELPTEVLETQERRPASTARLTVISGVGGKLPACFLVEYDGIRLLLDLGEGPEPGVRPDLGRINGPVDAILLSHAHEDHANALDWRDRIGNPPVFATQGTWDLLPCDLVPGEDRQLLPDRGTFQIGSIPITTGRSGHAPGGIWVHLALGGGLLYTGDYTTESHFYPFDAPPPAKTLIVDASYGDYDLGIDDAIDEIARRAKSGVVLPVPEGGRGPEMAVRLMERGLSKPFLDAPLRDQAERAMAGQDTTVAVTARNRLHAVYGTGFPAKPDPTGITICTDSNAVTGLSAQLLAQWGDDAPFVFTGHVPPGTPAAAFLAEGRATWLRWNVHPRRSDVVALAHETSAEQILLAFVEPCKTQGLQHDLAPRRILWGKVIDL